MVFPQRNFSKKVANDTYNNLVFQEFSKESVFLVGGYLRDILRNVKTKDRDYIVHGNVHEFTNRINRKLKGTTVFFDKSDTVRIVTKDGITLDFSKLSSSIENDLSKRDFTVNSIAWSPSQGIIDLYDGIADIRKKRIKCIFKDNFMHDPVRILRAYRFAAELDGYIEKGTRSNLKELHRILPTTASERITMEIFHLLNTEHAPKYLQMAFHDNVLNSIFLIKKEILQRNLLRMINIERKYLFKTDQFSEINFSSLFSEILNYKGLLRLSILVNIEKKPFYALGNLSLGNKIKKRIEKICIGMQLLDNANAAEKVFFNIFSEIKEASKDIAILLNKRSFFDEYVRYRKISKKSYLSSQDIMEISGIKEGKELGSIINKLKKAQYKSDIKNKRQARQLVRDLSRI